MRGSSMFDAGRGNPIITRTLFFNNDQTTTCSKSGIFGRLFLMIALTIGLVYMFSRPDMVPTVYKYQFVFYGLLLISMIGLYISRGSGFILGLMYIVGMSGSLAMTTYFVELLSSYDPAFGIIIPAALVSTFITFIVMVVLYNSGVINVSLKLRLLITGATIGFAITLLLGFILSLFIPSVANLMYNSTFGFIIAIVGAILAAFNILLDLDNIDIAVEQGVSSKYQFRLALGLLTSLIWLYVQLVRIFLYMVARSRR